MNEILVLCLNAAVDKTSVVRRFVPRALNRLERVLTLPGGKGINVARVLRSLGERPLLLGFIAGYTGDRIERGLRAEGVPARWVRLERGESRTCLSIVDGPKAPTEVNELGPRAGRRELARLESLYRALLPRSRLVIVSGSLPPGLPARTYARFIGAAKARGKPVLLDTNRSGLPEAVAEGPDLVKLNLDEAASLGLGVGGASTFVPALERLLRKGPASAVVTMGRKGAIACLDGRYLRAAAPKVRSLCPVGCGDTFLAALAHARLGRYPPERALAFATALATASAMVLGAGVYDPRDVPGVLGRVRVGSL